MADLTLHRSPTADMADQWLSTLLHHLPRSANNTAMIGSIVVILDALEWQGGARQVAEALPYGLDDMSVDDLRDTLARLGFKTKPLKEDPAKVSTRLCPYLFIGNDGKSYVVLDKGPDGVLMFDGSKGDRSWVSGTIPQGTCYVISAVGKKNQAPATAIGGWLREMANHFRKLIVHAFLATFVTNLLALAVPLAVMATYDQVISKEQPGIIPYIALGIGLAMVFEAGLRYLRAKLQAHIGGRMDYLVGTKVFEQILHLPPLFTERAPVGGQVTRLREFEQLREFFSGSMATALMDLPFVIIFVAVIAVLAAPIAIVPLVLLALFILLSVLTMPLLRDRGRTAGDARSKRYSFLVEMIWWLRSIKQMNGEDIWRERFREQSATAGWSNYHLSYIQSLSQDISQSLMTISGVATLGIGVFLTMAGDMTLGALIAVMMLVLRVLAPMQTLYGLASRIEHIRNSLQHLVQLLGYSREQEPGDAPSTSISFSGQLSFNRVSMRYSAEANPALLGVDFKVQPGEFIGITGSSGAGKSTLAKLALGIYRPQAGTVTLDGIDIRQLRPITLRQSLAYVPQRNHAFPGTIYENLVMAAPTASREEVMAACELAGLLQTIESLPQGFDTRFREGLLAHVPQGFLRKLGLARAFLRNAPVLVLDEPAGSMDDQDEEDFVRAIEALRGTRTVLMITHRPSHMRLCDRLMVLDSGQISLLGKPDEVLARVAEQNINLAPPPDSRPESSEGKRL